MFSLGQAVTYRNFLSDPFSPAILVGYSSTDSPIVTFIDKDGVLHRNKQVFAMDIRPVKQKNESSPSGKSIYLGPFCKKGFVGRVTIKLPDEAAVIKELRKISKLIQ